MALCYIAIACNGTRDNIYGVYPSRKEAHDRLKEVFADQADDEDNDWLDAQIVEIPDGGQSLDVEIHGKW